MKIDKRKLFRIFSEKTEKMQEKSSHPMSICARQEWMDYVIGLGCEIVKTPGGMLPFHSPHFIHIVDPHEIPDKAWHIQIPKNLALKILTIGLP